MFDLLGINLHVFFSFLFTGLSQFYTHDPRVNELTRVDINIFFMLLFS